MRNLCVYSVVAVCTFLATGCGAARSPEAFAPKVPVSYYESPSAEPSEDLAEWWTRFGDTHLQELIEEALARNLDLDLAEERIKESRSSLRGELSGYRPQIRMSDSYSRTRGAGSAIGLVGLPVLNEDRNVYSLGFDASWELGLFGKRDAAKKSGHAQLAASEAGAQAVRAALAGDVGHRYFSLCAIEKQIRTATAMLKLHKESAALAKSRFEAGLVPELDVVQAEAEVAGADAALAELANERAKLRHALAVLLNRDTAWVERALSETVGLPPPPTVAPAGIPADLLRRRPDVLQAGFELQAAIANERLARADRYPQISLTGSFGRQSNEAGNLTLGASRFFAVGPTIRIPLFTGGGVKSNIEAMGSRERQAAIRYQSLANQAIQEVEDSLASVRSGETAVRIWGQAAAGQQDALELVTSLYEAGLTDFRAVLDAQRSLSDAEDRVVSAERELLLAHVALYRALGGGWGG
jgi:NodT family efflux transporter outer membrane factor (OMF) lipoprotein